MFNKTIKKVVVGAAALLSLGGATLAATSADAYPWHGGGYGGWHGGYGWRGGYPVGAAVGAGLLGLAVGASLAHPAYGPAYGPYGYAGCGGFWRWSPQWGHYVYVHRC